MPDEQITHINVLKWMRPHRYTDEKKEWKKRGRVPISRVRNIFRSTSVQRVTFTTVNIFYLTLTLKTAAFVAAGPWKSEGMLGRILKVEKKVRKSVIKIEKKPLLGRLWLFGKGKNRLLFGCLWNAVIKWKWSTATKVRSYSDNGTLSLLVHCSTDRWTIAYGTQLHDVQ